MWFVGLFKRAISYLARYMAGVAISDRRLVSDSGGVITISYKDYKNRKQTGKKYAGRVVHS